MSIRTRPRGGVAPGQLDGFRRRVHESGFRVAQMATEKTTAEMPAMARALAELKAQHEQLLVADEELRAQLEQLAEMNEELVAERARNDEHFALTPLAQLVTDRFAVIRSANVAAAELLAIDRGFLRGKPLSAFLGPAELRQVNDALDRLAPGETVVELPLPLRTRAQQTVPTVAHVVRSARDDRVYWSFRLAGPERAAAAPTDRALRDKDELLVRERRARETLERANRAKDRFIAVLAHDLRAPLNAVLGWTQMLRNEILDREGRDRALATIERNGRNQLHLIEELLDISRIDADRVQLDLCPLDLGQLVQRHVETALPSAAAKGVSLVVAIDPELVVIADRQRIEQVMSNLVQNAIKFTDEGGTIRVKAERSGPRVRVTVSDSGRGVAPDVLPHVFEMYLQERNYASTRSGLGLGLYIVKQIVELHGGCVLGASAGPGRGSTFGFELPYRDAPPPAASEQRLPAAEDGLRGVRILVVDDDEDARDLGATFLRRSGAAVATATSLDSALEVFDFFRPDVLVSDIAMPGGDGLELVSRLRAQHDSPFAAVACSAFAGPRDADEALAAGFDAHVSKPIEAAELVAAVGGAVDLRGLRRR